MCYGGGYYTLWMRVDYEGGNREKCVFDTDFLLLLISLITIKNDVPVTSWLPYWFSLIKIALLKRSLGVPNGRWLAGFAF